MTPVAYGLLAGIAFGAISVGVMLPLQFADKRSAPLGAFLNRFAIGLLIPLITVGARRVATRRGTAAPASRLSARQPTSIGMAHLR
jgi:hypothetical protein